MYNTNERNMEVLGNGKIWNSADSLETKEDKEVDEKAIFEMAMADIAKIPVLTREEEMELGRRIRENGDLEARNELVIHNLRWAAKLAVKASKASDFSANDLYSELSLALLRAADKFDERKGVRFVTFSKYECDAAIGKFKRKFGVIPSISEHDSEVLSAIKMIQFEHYPKKLTHEDLADLYNASHKRQIDADLVGYLLDAMTSVSIFQETGDDDEGKSDELIDSIPSKANTTSLLAECMDERALCLQAINSLEPLKAEIMRLYCGFDGDPLNFREIGDLIGRSAERVRQLFKSACLDLQNGPFADCLSLFAGSSAYEEKVS